MYIYDNILLNSYYNLKCFKVCREIQNTFYVVYLFPENRAVYEVMWKNVVEADGPQMTI